MKPDIDSDVSLSAVTNVFCILRDITVGCITVGVRDNPGVLWTAQKNPKPSEIVCGYVIDYFA